MIKLVVLSTQARADLAALDRATALRIMGAIHRFTATGAGNVQGLRGLHQPEFRLRVGDCASAFTTTAIGLRSFASAIAAAPTDKSNYKTLRLRSVRPLAFEAEQIIQLQEGTRLGQTDNRVRDRSVPGGELFQVVDHQDIDRGVLLDQLEAELLLDGIKNGGLGVGGFGAGSLGRGGCL